ncbi:sensor histidine kinase [Spirillospora albida]|uniref:sensor histidine kinase n=1 Tax=Spirillospora albida TaxID=58123 RepID=UPI0004BF7385|nr:HAMP domain-containing sensor histidine kinase [Spirillospora albida]
MPDNGQRPGRDEPSGTRSCQFLRAVLALVEERLRTGLDARSDAIVPAGLRSMPGVTEAALRPAADPTDPGERTWPAGPGRRLGVVLDDDLDECGVPEALACLAALLDASSRPDSAARPVPADAGLDAEKSEFIATVVHDLATPLTPIVAYAGLLADPDTGPLTPSQQQFIEVIERNALRLSELLTDLPLLADPVSPELELRPERTDPMTMVRDVVAQFRPGALRSGVSLRFQARPGPALTCDPIRIRRMLDILLTGALTGSTQGDAIEVAARPTVEGWCIEMTHTVAGCGPAGENGEAAYSDGGEARAQWPSHTTARVIAGMHGGTLSIDIGDGRRTAQVRLPWEPPLDPTPLDQEENP